MCAGSARERRSQIVVLPARLSASERRIALVQILGELPPATAWLTTAQLACHFDCIRQWIEHDLEALRNAGKVRTRREGWLRLWAIEVKP